MRRMLNSEDGRYHPKTRDELWDLVRMDIPLGKIDIGDITDLQHVFAYSERKDFSGIETWDVSRVENMEGLFYHAEYFNGDISGWDVSHVKTMKNMFCFARALTGDISSWNVSAVEDMSGMFWYADSFNGDIGDWNVNEVRNMRNMFRDAWAFNRDLHWLVG
ncbi:MAG: DUF285 domain-containing protein, partial [Schwartzia sp.]|nr:DUF285 domain-containing protein [Schwartzia sp. (in: firmicutes)]